MGPRSTAFGNLRIQPPRNIGARHPGDADLISADTERKALEMSRRRFTMPARWQRFTLLTRSFASWSRISKSASVTSGFSICCLSRGEVSCEHEVRNCAGFWTPAITRP
jgi:hypothetical protein